MLFEMWVLCKKKCRKKQWKWGELLWEKSGCLPEASIETARKFNVVGPTSHNWASQYVMSICVPFQSSSSSVMLECTFREPRAPQPIWKQRLGNTHGIEVFWSFPVWQGFANGKSLTSISTVESLVTQWCFL